MNVVEVVLVVIRCVPMNQETTTVHVSMDIFYCLITIHVKVSYNMCDNLAQHNFYKVLIAKVNAYPLL